MELNELRWLEIHGLASFRDNDAPKAVVVAVSSIIDNSASAAVWSSMDTTQTTTTWSCWVVTERCLGRALIKYRKAHYDGGEERKNELAPSGCTVWVRPLTDIVGLRYGAFAATEDNPTVFEPAEPVKAVFRDGAISIPAGPIPVDQRAEAGRIIRALREGVNF